MWFTGKPLKVPHVWRKNLQELEIVAKRVNRDHANQIKSKGLWRAVSEAIANTVDHAYLKSRNIAGPDSETTKWWMFTQLRDSTFTVTVCDLGCGYRATISDTLPEQFVRAIAATFTKSNRDSLAIRTAMEYGRSGTRESYRGKGSRDAISVLEQHGTGELMILSSSGWMRYKFENGAEYDRSEGELETSIGGSIVSWKFPLEGVSRENG